MTQKHTPISCAEFQEHLPELFATANGNVDDPILKAHLDTCENCSTLVRDLQYIAEQARMLLEPAEEEPSDNVWSNIKNKLKSENAEDKEVNLSVAPPLTI
jgi:predicted anti-sigma-YlaC factor YlaD